MADETAGYRKLCHGRVAAVAAGQWGNVTTRQLLACGLSVACATGAGVRPALPQDDGGHKSYILPAVQIVAMDSLVNLAGRHLSNPANYDVTPDGRRVLMIRGTAQDAPSRVNVVFNWLDATP